MRDAFSVDKRSKEPEKCAANLFFNNILNGNGEIDTDQKKIIKSEIIIRQSSLKSKH
jgi:hypothetical protein